MVRRWCVRAGSVLVLAAVLAAAHLAHPSAAFAADDGPGASRPALWDWMEVDDSRGLPADGYSLSLDSGGLTDPGKRAAAIVANLSWAIYQLGLRFAIWFIDWVLGFAWFDWLTTPFRAIAGALDRLTSGIGAEQALMAIAALGIALLVARGRWATGLYELGMTLAVVALSTGLLANPIAQVAGDQGWIVQAKDTGLQVAAQIDPADDAGGTSSAQTPDETRQAITGQLVDTFLRTPHQLVNYGIVLDGSKCEKAYDQSIRGMPRPPQLGDKPSAAYQKWAKKHPPPNVGDAATNSWAAQIAYQNYEPRSVVAECSPEAGQMAANPGMGTAVSALSLMPVVAILMTFLLSLALLLFGSVVLALFLAATCVLRLLQAMVGGNGRGALWRAATQMAMSLVGIAATSVILVGSLAIIGAVATEAGASSVMAAIVAIDALLLVGIIGVLRFRRKLAEASARLAELMSKRPGAAPTRLPQPVLSPSTSSRLKQNGIRGALTAAHVGAAATNMVASRRTVGAVGRLSGRGGAAGYRGGRLALRGATGGAAGVAGWIARRLRRQSGTAELDGRPGPGDPPAPTPAPLPGGPSQPGLTSHAPRRQLEARLGHAEAPRPRGQLPPPRATRAPAQVPRRRVSSAPVRAALVSRTSPAGRPAPGPRAPGLPTPGRPAATGSYDRVVAQGQVLHLPTRR